jgi:hypothetical protein
MEAVNQAPQKAAPRKIHIQALIDRDVGFQFRALVAAHGLTMQEGLSWALRNLLTQAGIKVRADRGERGPYTDAKCSLQSGEETLGAESIPSEYQTTKRTEGVEDL